MSLKNKWMGKAAGMLPVAALAVVLMSACGETAAVKTTVPATTMPTTMIQATAMPEATVMTVPTAVMTVGVMETPGMMVTPGMMETPGAMLPMTVQMKEQNASGENGTANILHMGAGAGMMVNIDLSNGTTEPQPAHIHKGTCANLDPNPLVPLSDVVNGKSETTLPSTFTMETGQTYAINVHKSAAEISVYVSCGDITEGGAMMTPGAMETPGMLTESTPGLMP